MDLNPLLLRYAEEKVRVACVSVIAAIFLTTAKIVVGIITGSLGIISEAAHSGLDLAAALATVFAVKASSRPADDDHPYGHGKVENLSALFETLLLLVTCIWIIREAILRLIHPIPIESNILGFAVILMSIAVDLSRSSVLMKAAKKHKSQALEADALHFRTDVWSSIAVLLGLGLVLLGGKLNIPWLLRADATAAFVVAGIVIWVSVKLGRKTINDLLDAVPKELVCQARETVLKVPGVEAVPRIRMRRTGGEWFSDVIVQVNSVLNTEDAHQVANKVETALTVLMPGVDITVHVEPKEKEKSRI